MRDYDFTYQTPANEENLYRLKMVDRAAGTPERDRKDETFAYCGIRDVRLEDDSVTDLAFYPNPASDYVVIPNFDQVKEVAIHDLSGRKVYSSDNLLHASSTGQVNVKNLIDGIYVIGIKQLDGTPHAHKLLITKQ